MMNDDLKITAQDMAGKGVSSLRTAPNRGNTFGTNGLSAEDLKKRFDELPKLIVKRFNALIDEIESGNIPFPIDNFPTIADLADGIKNGNILSEFVVDALNHTLADFFTVVSFSTKGEEIGIDVQNRLSIGGRPVPTKEQMEKYVAEKMTENGTEVRIGGEFQKKVNLDVYVKELLSSLVGSSPEALDTLYELANAIGNDPNFAATLLLKIGEKADAKMVEESLNGKVDKSKGVNHVYCTNNTGGALFLTWAQSPSNGTIPRRTIYGGVETAYAQKGNDAVPLAQMNTELNSAISPIHTDVEILRKRVVNLEKGIVPDPEYTDSSVAYRKEVPQNALPYAAVMGVGGMTHRVAGKNLFNIEALKSDTGAVGRLTISGNQVKLAAQNEAPWRDCADYTTLLFKDVCPEAKVGKTYTLSCVTSPVTSGSDYEEGSRSVYMYPRGTFVLTEGMYNSPIEFYAGEYFEIDYYSMEAVFQNIMLNEGSVALPYVEYAPPKLQDTKVTALEIVGKNLFDEKAVTGGMDASGTDLGGQIVPIDGYIKSSLGSYGNTTYFTPQTVFLKKGQQVRISMDFYIPSGGAPTLEMSMGIGNPLAGISTTNTYFQLSGYDRWERHSAQVTAKSDGYHYVRAQGIGNSSLFVKMDVRVKNITVTTDLTATEYIPYRVSTFPIPAEVQTLDGYGWGIPDGAHNGIEFDDEGKAVYVKRVERKVYNGTEDWRGGGSVGDDFYITCFESTGAKYEAKGLSNKLAWRTPYPCVYTSNQAHRYMSIRPKQYATTDDEWKALLATWQAEGDPLIVYYELETPVVTDVSAYFSPDNFIEVEGGGVITAVNEHEQAAPTSILYQLKPTE